LKMLDMFFMPIACYGFIKPKIGGPLWKLRKLKIRISAQKQLSRKKKEAKTENSYLNQTFIFLG